MTPTKKRRSKAKPKLRKVWHDRDYRLVFGGNVWNIDVAQWSEVGHPERGELRVYRVEGDVSNQAILDRAILRLAKHRNLCLICEPEKSEGNATPPSTRGPDGESTPMQKSDGVHTHKLTPCRIQT